MGVFLAALTPFVGEGTGTTLPRKAPRAPGRAAVLGFSSFWGDYAIGPGRFLLADRRGPFSFFGAMSGDSFIGAELRRRAFVWELTLGGRRFLGDRRAADDEGAGGGRENALPSTSIDEAPPTDRGEERA